MYSLIVVGFAAFLLALAATPLARKLFQRQADRVPRAGGVPVLLAYTLSFAILLAVPLKAGHIVSEGLPLTWRLLPAALLIFLTGLLDDLIGLTAWQKNLAQCAAAGGAFWAGIRLAGIGGVHLGIWWSLPLTILWLLLCTNALNFIDGVDGLAAGLGLCAATTMLVAALLQHNVPLALAAAPLAGALLGFLRYNYNPATIFLGDSGSLFIGFLLGCFGILWSQKSTTILGMAAPIMALAIPLLDAALTVSRRFIRKQPIFTADSGHIHHRLLARGLTPRQVTLLLYGCCAVGAICSIAVMTQNISRVIVIVFCLVICVGIQQLGYHEFGAAGRMFLRGEFRSHIGATLSLDTLQTKLAAAITEHDCWDVIMNGAQGFGFHDALLSVGGRVFRGHNGPELNRCWTIRVPVSEGDYVELYHGFSDKAPSPGIALFVSTIRKGLTPKLAAFNGLAPRYRVRTKAETRISAPVSSCLFINQFFWPDAAATSQLLTDLASQVADDGHGSRVICSATSYSNAEDLTPPPVQVDRCPALPFKRGKIVRVASYFSFLATATFHAMRGPRPEAVVTLTTPPAVGIIGTLVQAVRGARHYIWEMDVYPDVAVDLGVLRRNSILTRILAAVFDFARHRAAGVIVLGEDMKDRLISHGIPEEKIHVCENWADGNEIRPQPFPDGPLTLYYSGNLGRVHEVKTISEAMLRLRHESSFRFIFAGGGARRRELESFCHERSITNVFFGPYCDRSDLGVRLGQGHLGLVTQRPETLGCVVPSKTYGIMAAGRPILYIGPSAGAPARIIEKFRCGWHIEPGDVESLVQLLKHLSSNPDAIRAAGQRARTAFEQNYDRPMGVARIAAVVGIEAAQEISQAGRVTSTSA